MAEIQPIIVFHGRQFVRHLGICNLICVKLLQIMFGVIPHNLKTKTTSLSQTVFLASTNTAYTQTHDDSISQNVIRCILPNKTVNSISIFCHRLYMHMMKATDSMFTAEQHKKAT